MHIVHLHIHSHFCSSRFLSSSSSLLLLFYFSPYSFFTIFNNRKYLQTLPSIWEIILLFLPFSAFNQLISTLRTPLSSLRWIHSATGVCLHQLCTFISSSITFECVEGGSDIFFSLSIALCWFFLHIDHCRHCEFCLHRPPHICKMHSTLKEKNNQENIANVCQTKLLDCSCTNSSCFFPSRWNCVLNARENIHFLYKREKKSQEINHICLLGARDEKKNNQKALKSYVCFIRPLFS